MQLHTAFLLIGAGLTFGQQFTVEDCSAGKSIVRVHDLDGCDGKTDLFSRSNDTFAVELKVCTSAWITYVWNAEADRQTIVFSNWGGQSAIGAIRGRAPGTIDAKHIDDLPAASASAASGSVTGSPKSTSSASVASPVTSSLIQTTVSSSGDSTSSSMSSQLASISSSSTVQPDSATVTMTSSASESTAADSSNSCESLQKRMRIWRDEQ
ncbi:hypothetical protein LTR66_013995 [Elasticomyces elasticus]|nr:hypothetical protein LTR66_013995 [Elasticomyces elasticus]